MPSKSTFGSILILSIVIAKPSWRGPVCDPRCKRHKQSTSLRIFSLPSAFQAILISTLILLCLLFYQLGIPSQVFCVQMVIVLQS